MIKLTNFCWITRCFNWQCETMYECQAERIFHYVIRCTPLFLIGWFEFWFSRSTWSFFLAFVFKLFIQNSIECFDLSKNSHQTGWWTDRHNANTMAAIQLFNLKKLISPPSEQESQETLSNNQQGSFWSIKQESKQSKWFINLITNARIICKYLF